MTAESKKDKGDSLKELEKLLSEDVMGDDNDCVGLIPKRELIAVTIRLSVVIVFGLVLYFTGVFDNLLVVLAAILMFLLVEAFNLLKARNNTKKERLNPLRNIPGKKRR